MLVCPEKGPWAITITPIVVFIGKTMFLYSFRRLVGKIILVFCLGLRHIVPRNGFQSTCDVCQACRGSYFFLRRELVLVAGEGGHLATA